MDCGSPHRLDGAQINAWRRLFRLITLPARRYDVSCQESVVGSLAGGKTRIPSSIGGSTRLNGAGVHELHFHGLRDTFATWLLEAGVDYIVIEKLLGHRLPGTGDLYIHDWDSRLREAVTRLAVLTEQKLREKIAAKKQEKSSRCHHPI